MGYSKAVSPDRVGPNVLYEQFGQLAITIGQRGQLPASGFNHAWRSIVRIQVIERFVLYRRLPVTGWKFDKYTHHQVAVRQVMVRLERVPDVSASIHREVSIKGHLARIVDLRLPQVFHDRVGNCRVHKMRVAGSCVPTH